MFWSAKNPPGLFLSILVVLLVGYGVFEAVYTWGFSQEEESTEQKIAYSLDSSAKFFEELSVRFQEKSDRIFQDVNDAIQLNTDRMTIYNHLKKYDVWGITVLKNNQKWVWEGFDLTTPSDSTIMDNEENVLSVVNYNNVIVYLSKRSLIFNNEKFIVLSAKKLYQISNLPFTNNSYQFSDESVFQNSYPVYFNFFGSIPENAVYRTLQTNYSDSVGTVYALPEEADEFKKESSDRVLSYRLGFRIAIFLAFSTTLFVWASRKKKLAKSLILFFLTALGWPVLVYSGFIESSSLLIYAITPEPELTSIQDLTAYSVNGVFIFLLFLAFQNLLQLIKEPEWSNSIFRTFILSVLFGALQVLLILFFIQSTEALLTNSRIPLLDLELAPNVHSFFFYIFSALFFTGVAGLIVTAGYHLYRVEQGKSILIAIFTSVSFLCTYFILDLVWDDFEIVDWIFLLAILLLFVFLFTVHFLTEYPEQVVEMSGFRKLMFTVFVVSTTVYIIIWNATNMRLDRTLIEQVAAFAEEDSVNTQRLLFDLLSDIEQSFDPITEETLNQRSSNVQIHFQQLVQQKIPPEWNDYSFYMKLLSKDGTEIASYSTTVEIPIWSESRYNVDVMLRSYRGEQIRWYTNRPVIWDSLPLNLPERIISLSRGWIPIYDSENPREIVAWIAADVYLERADYNKPMRAVLSKTPTDAWKQSFYLAEFTGTRLTKSAMLGLYHHQPQYHRLPEKEFEIALRDSINFLTNKTTQGSFREVLVNTESRKIVKASTPFPGPDQHLFSYFRLQIVLVFFGLFCLSILSLAGLTQFSPFGQSRKFNARLIDGLTLATILFLIVLTFATQYAVDRQNERNLERELIQNLGSLSESLKRAALRRESDSEQIQLTNLSFPLNLDVIFYENANVSESTTPQVFQQNLMPSVIPFPVFDFVYNRQRSHYITTSKIGDEELLIGYQSVLNSAGRTIGVIAIPMFLQSPVYNEQLLETTSYLFVVYLFIFALFIGGSVFLSGQLTKPISLIQAGLKKISRGEMKTRVAVTSRDEIGSLANAYNNMVQRLEEVQKELLKAERESAWKEMAQQVAHEIKNPLTPMKLNLQHLQRQLENYPEKAEELKPVIEKTAKNIIGQIESLSKIASDFSKFAQPVQEPKENVDLSELIESVSDLYNHEFAVHIDLNLPDQPVCLSIVKDEMRRVLVNLIKNALEACDNGRAVIEIALEKNTTSVLFKISDNGSGIHIDDHDKIFVPKFSTKSSGTGLGLAITKKIVEAHNGKIWFESKKSKGTTFFIELPLN